MKNFMIALLIICALCAGIGALIGNVPLGMIPCFIAFWPAAYFGADFGDAK